MKIYYGYFSECGPRRKNEDYIAIREMPEQGRAVFVLCDGMGGHGNGDVASRLVAEHICGYWEKNPKRRDSEKKIQDACKETMIAFNNGSRGEMGTTMVMAAIEGSRALLAHCGDSRIYVVRNNRIIYQSTDHITLTPEGWPIISRAFFTNSNSYMPDIKGMDIEVGDMILLCSDGVYGYAKGRSLKEALEGKDVYSYPLRAYEKIAAENAHDNYSAILIRICEDEPVNKEDPDLFKISRHVETEEGWITSTEKPIECFRKRRDAHDRLVELNCYNAHPHGVRYSCGRP